MSTCQSGSLSVEAEGGGLTTLELSTLIVNGRHSKSACRSAVYQKKRSSQCLVVRIRKGMHAKRTSVHGDLINSPCNSFHEAEPLGRPGS